ncbi:MAG: DUF7507 domain-containing protein, partial [Acidimicrobiales bacterium]
TATYNVTQVNLTAGSITNKATVTAKGSTTKTVTATSTATVTATQGRVVPTVSIVKHAIVTPPARQATAVVGDTIAYTYTVTNTSPIDLTSVAVTDPTWGTVTCPVPAAPGLAPGASETCTAKNTYAITQTDINIGSVSDTATAKAKGTDGLKSPVSPPSTVTVSIARIDPLVLVKSATPTTVTRAGAVVTYHFTVKNTGNITLYTIKITDPMAGLSSVTCPDSTLTPTVTETCTATYTVTQANFNAGMILNSAKASGSSRQGVIVQSNSSTATVVVSRTRHVTLGTLTTPIPVSGSGSPKPPPYQIISGGGTVRRGDGGVVLGGLGILVLSILGGCLLLVDRRRRHAGWSGSGRPQSVPDGVGTPGGVAAEGVGSMEARATSARGSVDVERARPRRRALAGLAVMAVLGVVIASVGVTSTSSPGSAPLPQHPFSVPHTSGGLGPAVVAAVPRQVPNELSIPSLGVVAPLVPETIVGSSLGIPGDVKQVGIWTGGAPVDSPSGTVLLAGHINWYNQGNGALYDLSQIKPGAIIHVSDSSGNITTWVASSLQAYPKSELPQDIFSPNGSRQLVLVTCGGAFVPSTGHYVDNVVVRAVPA